MNHLFNLLHNICRATYPEWATVERMGVDHGGAHVVVSEELLDCADVLPPFRQMRHKGVAEPMSTGGLAHTGSHHGAFHGLLHHAWIQMVTALGA